MAAVQTGKCVLSMAASNGWAIQHSDVQSTFLQAELAEAKMIIFISPCRTDMVHLMKMTLTRDKKKKKKR